MYRVSVSSAYYVPNKDDKSMLEWADENADSVSLGEFDTYEEAYQHLVDETEGSRWCLYPAAFIENDAAGEVFSSVPILYRCECCGNEKWDNSQMTASAEWLKPEPKEAASA